MSELAKRCRAMVTGNEQYTMAEWQDTLLKAADLIEKQDRLLKLYREYCIIPRGLNEKEYVRWDIHRSDMFKQIKQMEETL